MCLLGQELKANRQKRDKQSRQSLGKEIALLSKTFTYSIDISLNNGKGAARGLTFRGARGWIICSAPGAQSSVPTGASTARRLYGGPELTTARGICNLLPCLMLRRIEILASLSLTPIPFIFGFFYRTILKRFLKASLLEVPPLGRWTVQQCMLKLERKINCASWVCVKTDRGNYTFLLYF